MRKVRNNGYLESIPTTKRGLINPIDARFYYIRDGEGHPRTTVCLGKDRTGKISRGISICSDNDTVNKPKGRKLAYIRMNQARTSGETTGIIASSDRSSVANFMDDNPSIDFKSEADILASCFELSILESLD